MGLADARKRAEAAQAAAASGQDLRAQQLAQQAAAYALLVERIDPLVQGLRRAIKRRGGARLTLMQRLVHRNAYGSQQRPPAFEDFTSTRHIKGDLYRDVRAGKKFLRVHADGRLLIGLNVNEWYWRSPGNTCECRGTSSAYHNENHMMVVVSNVVAYANVDDLAVSRVSFEVIEEWIAFAAKSLGIPDDEVEG